MYKHYKTLETGTMTVSATRFTTMHGEEYVLCHVAPEMTGEYRAYELFFEGEGITCWNRTDLHVIKVFSPVILAEEPESELVLLETFHRFYEEYEPERNERVPGGYLSVPVEEFEKLVHGELPVFQCEGLWRFFQAAYVRALGRKTSYFIANKMVRFPALFDYEGRVMFESAEKAFHGKGDAMAGEVKTLNRSFTETLIEEYTRAVGGRSFLLDKMNAARKKSVKNEVER